MSGMIVNMKKQSVLRDVNADSDLPDFKSYNEIRTYLDRILVT